MHIQISTITGKKIRICCTDVKSLQNEIESAFGIPVEEIGFDPLLPVEEEKTI